MSKGFTLMEVLIAMFLFVVATIAIVGASVLVSKTSFKVEQQVVAQAIMNDTIEKLHGLPYSKVGEVPSGAEVQSNSAITSMGGIEYKQSIQQGQQEYVVITDVIPIDDPANGDVSGTISLTNADYKTVRVQVNPTLGGVVSGAANSGSVVAASTTIANWPPQSCVPGEANACEIPALPTPLPTFKFNFKGEPISFINGLGIYATIPAASGIYNDAASRLQVCSLKGYNAQALDRAGNWSSCDSNYNAKWNSTTNTFDVTSGCSPTNSQSSEFTCSSPKPIANCTYTVACPASGKCTDAYLVRGYTPPGVQYASTCKSNADCDAGYACNTGVTPSVCEVAGSLTCL